MMEASRSMGASFFLKSQASPIWNRGGSGMRGPPSTSTAKQLAPKCALPPDSTTLLADAARWAALLPTKREYTCIVADPPWPSRSAARRAAYDTRGDAWRAPLLALPVADLVAPSGALVAVWATNDKKVARWVVDTLFRAWGVEYVGTWYWLKCTSSGAPVLSIDEHAERKPWEPLVVGVVIRGLFELLAEIEGRPSGGPQQWWPAALRSGGAKWWPRATRIPARWTCVAACVSLVDDYMFGAVCLVLGFLGSGRLMAMHAWSAGTAGSAGPWPVNGES